MKYDVTIIGGGLGGLQCAYILVKNGKNVCLIEKERTLGGCLQTFHRHGREFDTGFHYVGGMGQGEPLNRIFSYFNLADSLPWVQLDTSAFDEVHIAGKSYFMANCYDRFVESMARYFPRERANLQTYASLLRQVNQNIANSFDPRSADELYTQSLFARSAYQYLNDTFSDPLLIQVLSGTSLKMELTPQLPLYIFAQINSSFVQSAWRLRGGGQQIADHLAADIKAMGATIITGAETVRFDENDSRITAAILADGQRIEADTFISDIHPAATMKLLASSRLVRRIYRNRISSLPNTYGMFTVNCRLKPGIVPYLNRNIYSYSTDNLWQLCNRDAQTPVEGVMISFQPPADGSEYTDNIDLLTPISYNEVAQWADSKPLRRPDGYNAFKQRTASACIEAACRHIPGLADAIDASYTSTPLTYAHYTATHQGSAYGIAKDCNNLMYTLLSPRTPIANLLLTGQNLNLHGILGVSMTSFITASQIIGPTTPFSE